MAKFPFSFRTKVSDNPRLDLALATNFDKAMMEPGASVADGSLPFASGGSAVWRASAGRVAVGSLDFASTTGNLAVTGLGFKPSLVVFNGSGSDTAAIIQCRGAMDSDGSQFTQATTVSTALGVAISNRVTTACVKLIRTNGTTRSEAAFVSMDADGFTVNRTTASADVIDFIAYA